MHILMVCVGNVCRSPLAERLLERRMREADLDGTVTVSSAGVLAMVGRVMEEQAAAELRRLGGDPDGFVARRLSEAVVRDSDLVLTATADVRRRVLEEAPGALRRTFTLREFAALVADDDESATPAEMIASAVRRRSQTQGWELDVVDPMRQGPEVHAEAADLIEAAVDVIAAALARVLSASRC